MNRWAPIGAHVHGGTLSNGGRTRQYERLSGVGSRRACRIADTLLTETLAVSQADTASVMLVEDDGLMRIATAHGLAPHVVNACAQRSGEGIAGWVLAMGRPVIVGEGSAGTNTQRRDLSEAVSLPIAHDGAVAGVLNAGWREQRSISPRECLPAMEALARIAGAAIAWGADETPLAGPCPRSDTDAWSASGDEVRQVAELATAIAEAMGLDQPEAQTVRLAAILHDVGMHTGGGATYAPGPMTTTETALVRMHPVVTAERPRLVDSLEHVIPAVLRVLKAGAGSQFDPALIDNLTEVVSENRMAAR